MSVPNSLRYESIPQSIKATSKVVSFNPSNSSSFSNGGNNLARIEIRSGGMSFLNGAESYLKFSISQNSTNACQIDGYGSACINRIRLLSAGTVITDTTNYNILSNYLINNQSSDDFQRMMQITSGAVLDQTDVLFGGAAGGQGRLAGAGAVTQTYAIPLINSFLTSKYVPISMLSGALTLEITFENNFATVFNSAVAFEGSQTYNITNVAYVATIIELQDENTYRMLQNMMATQGLAIHADIWEAHINNIGLGVTSAMLTIPDRSECLKSVNTVFVRAGAFNASGIQTYKYDLTSYQYRLGSTYMPVSPVNISDNNYVESFTEMLKTFNTSIFSLGNRTYANALSFGNDTNYLNTGCFSACVDCEAFGDQTTIESGINTSRLSLPLLCDLKFSVVTPVALTAISFCHKDAVFLIRGDGSIVVSV